MYCRLPGNGEAIRLVDTVGTSACRQSQPGTAMDYRVISVHSPFTPVPPHGGGMGCR